MSVRRIKEPELRRCESVVISQRYRDNGLERPCVHKARYEIDGHCFCEQHAGRAALDFMLQRGF